MNNPAVRGALEDLWRERVRAALDRYRFAADECLKIRKGPGAARVGSPEHVKVLRAESAAFAEYSRVAAIFNDLTVNGKIPPAE